MILLWVANCWQAGGVFVDQAAREILLRKLEGSVFVDNDYIDAMVDSFEKNVSLTSCYSVF